MASEQVAHCGASCGVIKGPVSPERVTISTGTCVRVVTNNAIGAYLQRQESDATGTTYF
jgi:hypothetical protein